MSRFHDHINKCRCCFAQFDKKEARIMINESHREIYRTVIKVELRIDSNLSACICEKCNEMLIRFSESVQEFARIQKIVNDIDNKQNVINEFESIDNNEKVFDSETVQYDVIELNNPQFYDEIKIEEEQIMFQETITDSDTAIRECYVRIERLELKYLPKVYASADMIDFKECYVNLGRQVHNKKTNTKIPIARSIESTTLETQKKKFHIKKRHRRERPNCRSHSCDICGKKYYSALKMEGHMKLTHAGPAKCFDRTCLRSFCSWTKAKEHYYKNHNSDRKV